MEPDAVRVREPVQQLDPDLEGQLLVSDRVGQGFEDGREPGRLTPRNRSFRTRK